MQQDLHKFAIEIAHKSPCTKRKVGAVIVDKRGKILSTGYNTFPEGGEEFDDDGRTHPDVIHAEVAACKKLPLKAKPYRIIVTHEPCDTCRTSILAVGIRDIEIATSFMKWSQDKIMYSLVPVKALKELASVFTYGAKKYKSRNYLECQDKEEFVSAIFRHLEAYRAGEILDQESSFHHLAHMMCNASILMDLEEHEETELQQKFKGV